VERLKVRVRYGGKRRKARRIPVQKTETERKKTRTMECEPGGKKAAERGTIDLEKKRTKRKSVT